MAMKLDFICCIGSELKNVISGTTKNSRIYMYRAYENQTIADMTQDGFFNQAQELRENDLIVLFDPENDNAYDMVKVSSVRGGIVKTTKVQTPDIKTIFARLKELSEKIDKEITDRTKADSVLQKQITTNANNIATNTGNITTLRNDVDGLGDQVHEIEAKIPQNATASNQLATKADLVTKADTTTVNTELAKKQDKLVSGTNIKTVNGETLLGSGNIQIESGGAMPVGAIFTTPRTGTIEGAVEANGSSYNIADYSGAGSIGALLAAGNIAYVSKTEFQTQVANTGACESFGWNGSTDTLYAWTAASVTRAAQPVSEETYYTKSATPAVGDNLYDSTGKIDAAKILEVASDYSYIVTDLDEGYYNHIRDTSKDIAGTSDPTFLVPKLNPWHIGKFAPVAGNGITLGLTNGTTNMSMAPSAIASEGIFAGNNAYGKPVGTNNGSFVTGANSLGITTDPTKSGIVSDLSETTNLRVMVQLATGATDEALETCTSVLSDVSALNAHRVIEFQAPTAANSYTWYRKYADGWVEQGGRYPNRQNISTTMPVEMSDTNYSVVLTYEADSTFTPQYASLSISTSKTTTSFTIKNAGSIFGGWQVSGMASA